MARYIPWGKADDKGHQSFVGDLELEGYFAPSYCPADGGGSQEWPFNAINGLIYLFTGQIGDDSDGIEIPEVLGWHIATLIELWSQESCPLGEEGAGLLDESKLGLAEYLAFQAPEYPPKQALQYANCLMCYRHAKHRQRIVQQWYSDGIRLYQATRPAEDR